MPPLRLSRVEEGEEATLPPPPAAISLHSFTGTAAHVREFLGVERAVREAAASSSDDGDPPACCIYFGISHLINVLYASDSAKARRKAAEAVRSIPPDRLLLESDASNASDGLAGIVGACEYLADVLEIDEEEVVDRTTANTQEFLRLSSRAWRENCKECQTHSSMLFQ